MRVSSKPARLRALFYSNELEFLIEAHNGISARIAEEAGFKGIWASGLALSAQYGVRDNNEASWTQVVDMLEFMSDATIVPILLDGDTGYGNFNNMRRLVKKLEQRNVAGVCIEDKLFPKTNSFIDSARQPLCDIDEFCGKIKAGKDSQLDENFCIVARVEALVAGWGLEEALQRADAYRSAGADAILIHSTRSSADEVLAFAKHWENRLPLIIVPTRYYSTPTEIFRMAGISTVIWANHLIRAAVIGMQTVAREIQSTQAVADVEDRIASMTELFRLQGAEELAYAEKRYLAANIKPVQAVVLAATRGQGLEAVTHEMPKVMLRIGDKSLLQRLVDAFKRQHVHRISVVAGYKADAVTVNGIEVIRNPNYARGGELTSLACARGWIGEDTVITYGDLLFRHYILRDLLDMQGEIMVVVDSALPPKTSREYRDLAYCSRPNDHALFHEHVDLLRIASSGEAGDGRPSGRWIGMLRVAGNGRNWLLKSLEDLRTRSNFASLGMPDLLNHMIEAGRQVKVLYIHGHWLDVNRLEDLGRASDFAHGRQQSAHVDHAR
ncbi:MAG: phosphoenolpyruvate mutase [Pseudomonadota bacterium]|nr:phosphoenolpyruvate mutase [Pseudomonadota bacterium]